MSKTMTKITGPHTVPGDTKFGILQTYFKRAHCSESLVTTNNTKFPDFVRKAVEILTTSV
jgi:hypothetical protein